MTETDVMYAVLLGRVLDETRHQCFHLQGNFLILATFDYSELILAIDISNI